MPAAFAFPEVSALPVQRELPDPLRRLDGSRVVTPEDWRAHRRPELAQLFAHYMYGYAPAAPPMDFRRAQGDQPVLNGKATAKALSLCVVEPQGVAPIELLLVVPERRSGPVPVFLGINFAGNHSVLAEPALPEARCDRLGYHARASRGSAASSWNVAQIIERGYAFATFHTCDVKPDRPCFEEGIQRHFLPPGQSAPGPHDWAALRAWAWAASRAIDYLQTDPDVDPRRIAIVGHSRLGKAAMIAAAFDERIALTIALQAGCGGSAPSRSNVGESVRQINQAFPHWFTAEFKKFGPEPARLPFDQHCLVALIAPRPLLFANATDDSWANPLGQFEMLRAAEPVYALLGSAGLRSRQLPGVGELSAGKLGYFLRAGGHSMTSEDWSAFLSFADQELRAVSSD